MWHRCQTNFEMVFQVGFTANAKIFVQALLRNYSICEIIMSQLAHEIFGSSNKDGFRAWMWLHWRQARVHEWHASFEQIGEYEDACCNLKNFCFKLKVLARNLKIVWWNLHCIVWRQTVILWCLNFRETTSFSRYCRVVTLESETNVPANVFAHWRVFWSRTMPRVPKHQASTTYLTVWKNNRKWIVNSKSDQKHTDKGHLCWEYATRRQSNPLSASTLYHRARSTNQISQSECVK